MSSSKPPNISGLVETPPAAREAPALLPPEEHAGAPGHQLSDGCSLWTAEWIASVGAWTIAGCPGYMTPEQGAATGWSYVSPLVRPAPATLRADDVVMARTIAAVSDEEGAIKLAAQYLLNALPANGVRERAVDLLRDLAETHPAPDGGRGEAMGRAIFGAIRNFHLTNMCFEDTSDPYPLVDAMTCPGKTIADGEEQMELLADEIFRALTPTPDVDAGGSKDAE